MTDAPSQMPEFCTMRDAGDEIHLECRFPNGEKYAAVSVCSDKPELAEFIMKFINTRAASMPSDKESAISDLSELEYLATKSCTVKDDFDLVENCMKNIEAHLTAPDQSETIKLLTEALKLADAALSGSNMNMKVVEKSVKRAIAQADRYVPHDKL